MSIRRKSILTNLKGATGDVFKEPGSVKGANGFFDAPVWVFNDSGTDIELHGRSTVPQGYQGGGDVTEIVVTWSTTATSGDVEWGFTYRAVGGNDLETLDDTDAQEALLSGNNDTAPSGTDERMEYKISITDANLTPGDTFQWILSREGGDGGDTISAAIRVFELELEANIL